MVLFKHFAKGETYHNLKRELKQLDLDAKYSRLILKKDLLEQKKKILNKFYLRKMTTMLQKRMNGIV